MIIRSCIATFSSRIRLMVGRILCPRIIPVPFWRREIFHRKGAKLDVFYGVGFSPTEMLK